MNDRLEVRARVLECTGCGLSREVTPVPFHGPTPNAIAIIGEAPGSQETTIGQPFVGPSGELIRASMEALGLPHQAFYWMNVISCMPRGVDGSPRQPTASEVFACSGNFWAQLDLATPRFALLCGRVALERFRPDLRISKVHGQAFTVPSRPLTVFPVYHPSFILRTPQESQAWREDLARFAQLAYNNVLPDYLCAVCRVIPDETNWLGWHIDDWGVAYCPLHRPKGS